MTHALQAPALVFWLPLDEAARRFEADRAALVAAVRAGELEVRAKVIGGEVVASVSSADLAARFGPPRAVPRDPTPDASEERVSTRTAPGPVALPAVPEPAPVVGPTPAELDALHGRLVAAEDRARVLELDRARLEGRLETADRVERGLQRYADKLETRLDETVERYEERLAGAERMRLELARVVGRMEEELLRLEARLERYEGDGGPALLAAGTDVSDTSEGDDREDGRGPAATGRRRRERAPKKRRWFRRG